MRSRLLFALLGLALMVYAPVPSFADTGPPVTMETTLQDYDPGVTLTPVYTMQVQEGAFEISGLDLEFAEDAFVTHQTPYSGDRAEGIPRLDLHPPNQVAGFNFVNKSSYSFSITECDHAPRLANYLYTIGRWV